MTPDQQYNDCVKYILSNGVRKPNRTGIDTIGVFGYQMRFDLRDDTLPLLTTKKVHTKSIIHELLWMISGSTNIKYLNDNGVTIWNEWSTQAGHLNKIYGFQWRKWEIDDWLSDVVEIPIRSNGVDAPFEPLKNPTVKPSQDDDLTGQKLQNNEGDLFTVIRKISKPGDKNSRYLVQFENTTSLVEGLRPNIRRGQIRDPYKISVFGQGCMGEYKEKHPYYKVAYNLWYNMMRRCYDCSIPQYYLYGGVGVFVDQQWRCFANFLRDIHDLVYFTKWVANPSQYDLDKDYFGTSSYSKNTCIFLPSKYNQILPKLDGCKYVATNKISEQKYEFTVQRWFARQHNIKYSQNISTALHTSSKQQTRDWVFEKVQPRQGYVYRQQCFVDQVAQIVDKLKNSPNDRRMIISAWNVAEIPNMKLPPCHYTFQFYTKPLTQLERIRIATRTYNPNDIFGDSDLEATERFLNAATIPKYELSVLLNQRSCDVGLGVPFNIVQYSLLLHMFAEVANMIPGEFIWSGADVHIYTNHIDQLNEQITRTLYPSPKFHFGRKITNIDDFKYDDFIIEDYKSHPAIKMDVAV